MFRLKLLIRFSLLVNYRSNGLAHRWVFRINWYCVEAKQISNLIPFRSSGLLCVDCMAIFLHQHRPCLGAWFGLRCIIRPRSLGLILASVFGLPTNPCLEIPGVL